MFFYVIKYYLFFYLIMCSINQNDNFKRKIEILFSKFKNDFKFKYILKEY